jgi:hypothetical protein
MFSYEKAVALINAESEGVRDADPVLIRSVSTRRHFAPRFYNCAVR